MKNQDQLLDNFDRTTPKKISFLKVLLIGLLILFIGFFLVSMFVAYQFKDFTEL